MASASVFAWGPRFYRTLSALTILVTAGLILFAKADQRLVVGLTFVTLSLALIVLFMVTGQRIANRRASALRLVRLTRIVFVAMMVHALVTFLLWFFAPESLQNIAAGGLLFLVVEFFLGLGLALTNQRLVQYLEQHEAAGDLT